MNLKPYIAILFAIMFFGKFLVMDSKMLTFILNGDEIVYINPFCKKHNSKLHTDNQESISQDSNIFNMSIDSFCNAPFNFEVFSWESNSSTKETSTYTDYNPSLPESAKARFYPPPRA